MYIFVAYPRKMSKKTDIESRILDVSYRLFLKHGYKNTTMDDISQALAISKKTLYKYFPGKLELLAASFDLLKTKLSVKVESLFENRYISFTTKLKSFLAIVAADLAPINSQLLEDLRGHAPEVWVDLQDYIRDSAYLRFQKLIEEGIDKGQVTPGINKTMIILVYASAIQSLIDPKFLAQFPFEMREKMNLNTSEIFDQTIQIIYQGILTEEAREAFQKT
jgi:AcrR family transcriptional regulator